MNKKIISFTILICTHLQITADDFNHNKNIYSIFSISSLENIEKISLDKNDYLKKLKDNLIKNWIKPLHYKNDTNNNKSESVLPNDNQPISIINKHGIYGIENDYEKQIEKIKEKIKKIYIAKGMTEQEAIDHIHAKEIAVENNFSTQNDYFKNETIGQKIIKEKRDIENLESIKKEYKKMKFGIGIKSLEGLITIHKEKLEELEVELKESNQNHSTNTKYIHKKT